MTILIGAVGLEADATDAFLGLLIKRIFITLHDGIDGYDPSHRMPTHLRVVLLIDNRTLPFTSGGLPENSLVANELYFIV